MNIVLTREHGRNDNLRAWLPADAVVREVPATETNYFDETVVRASCAALPASVCFETLVVTSARAARYVAAVHERLCDDHECFSVGASTTTALAQCGVRAGVQSSGPALDLARQVARGPVLLLGAASSRDELGAVLRDRGLTVESVACYETRPVDLDDDARRALGDADVVFVGAPSAWRVVAPLVDARAWVVVPGPTTADSVRHDHERVLEGWGPSVLARLERANEG